METGTAVLKDVEPVQTGYLFEDLHRELIELLRGLTSDDWERPTSAGPWRVRNVAAHLLDGDIRRLSIARDGHRPVASRPLESYADLLRFLNELNDVWVEAAERISPAMLIDLLAHVGPQASSFLRSLDPFGRAPLPVAWAGQATSPNWLDVGREYTERWHHQDQIREAVGAPPLTEEKWLRPVLEISVRALPHAYRDLRAGSGEVVELQTTGTVRKTWSLLREDSGWVLLSGRANNPKCRIILDSETVARLLLHRVPTEHVRERIRFEGEERLIGPFLDARAVMVAAGSRARTGRSG